MWIEIHPAVIMGYTHWCQIYKTISVTTVIDFCEGQEQIFFTSALFSSLSVTLSRLFFSYFSSNIPNTFQTFQWVDRILRRIYRQWRNWQWDIVRDVQQSSPHPGASKSLPAAAAVSISWILPVFPIHTTLRPLISPSVSFQAPRGRHGSAKTSIYTLS